MSTLGYLFSAALKKGRQIKFLRPVKGAQWEPLVRWELPKFDGEPVDTRIVVHGRGARVYCGVVRQGELNPRGGFTYSHEWRVIEQASAHGCGPYSSVRVCGFVDLDSSWPLTKNKDGVSRDAEALYAEVERAALPVLQRAHSIGTELRSQQFDAAANRALNELLSQRAKAKRSKGTKKGTVRPVDTDIHHTRAEKEQPGETFPSRQSSGRFVLDFRPFGHPNSVGEVKPPSQVVLNLDCPAISDLRHRNDMTSIVLIALALLSAEHCDSDTDRPLFKSLPKPAGFSTTEFSKAMGALLSTPIMVDGKTTLKVVGS
jgi:hypothetical protein